MPFAVIAAIGTAVGLYGSYRSYSAQKDASAQEAAFIKREGAFTKQESIFEALKIREDTRREIGTAKAKYAGAGVVGGTTIDVVNHINYRGQRDALWVLYTGELAKQGAIRRGAATSSLGSARAEATLAQGIGNALVNFASMKEIYG